MHGLTGTWQLVRLGLRLDRVKLPLVILVICAMYLLSAVSVVEVYGSDIEQQINYAATTAPSIVGRVFAGPLHGPETGAIVMNETFLFTAVAVAFMSTLTVIRHTRQNEEAGRAELVGSAIVSRHAPLAAALLVSLIANIAVAVLSYLILLSAGLPAYGAFLTGVSIGVIGLAFSAIAGVAAQLTDGSRSANGLCALFIGIAFLLRAIGDSTGNLVNNGLGIRSSFISWLSPLGWGQQMYPFSESRTWIFCLFIGLIIIALSLATYLMVKRDIGSGIFAAKLGRARASKSLLTSLGLANRLQKGNLRGWAVATLVMAVSFGLVINEFQNFLEENDEFREAIVRVGDNVNHAFLSILIAFMGILITGYVTQALSRMKSEETSGQIESVLATTVSRTQWIMSHVVFIALGVLFLLFLSALGMGLTYVISTGESWSELGVVLVATLTQALAIFTFAAFVISVFSFAPNLMTPIAWGCFGACVLVLQLGVILDLPQWVLNLSPFGHLPAMPAEGFKTGPAVWLTVTTAALFGISLFRFKNRDISIN